MATSLVKPEESLDSNNRQDDFINVHCNWQVKTDKQIRDTVSTINSTQVSERFVKTIFFNVINNKYT